MLSEPIESTTAVLSLRSSTIISQVSRQPTGGLMETGDVGDLAARLLLALTRTGESFISRTSDGITSRATLGDVDRLRAFLGAGDSKSSDVANGSPCDAVRLREAIVVRCL